MTRYLSAEKYTQDDFGDTFTQKEGEAVYDAATKGYNGRLGPWATMTEKSFKMNGYGKLGLGLGQKYVRNAAGELHKVEG
jgi:hypothetical protein